MTLNDQGLGQGGGESSDLDPSTVQGNSLQASSPADTDYLDGFNSDQVIKYTVQSGDTIGSIASDFSVSINTIVWANNLRNPNSLSLGEVLKIPPVSGVIHTVQTGDTIASIAKKYKADPNKILSFNNMTDSQDFETGNELMVPGGEQPGPKPSVKPAIAKRSEEHGMYKPTGNGQCVDFVQAHGFSRFRGNAYQWAKFTTPGIAPATGQVVVLKGGRWGHVALITAVKENSIQVVEQNFYGHYIIDHREISLADKAIIGFVQP
jgi:LysM repeat protein